MANIVQYIIDFSARGGNAVVRHATQLQNRLDAANASAGRLSLTVGKNLRDAFMSLPGASFFMNPIVAMGAGIGVVSRLGMQAESTATAFNVLVGSQEKASSMLGDLNKYADDTIWNRKEIQEAARTMLGYTVSADTVIGDMKRLGDIAMGDKSRLQQLALAFGQVASAGKLQGQELLQLINAGYNPLQDIASLTGKTMAEVRDEMSKGNISYEMFRQAIVKVTSAGGRYYGMTEKLAQTTQGRFEQMKGNVTQALLGIYKIIQPMLIPAFQTVINILEALNPVIDGVSKAFQWLFNVLNSWSPVLVSLTALIGTWTAAVIVNTTVLKGWNIVQLAHYGILLLAEKALRAWNLALSASPMGIAIAVVSALAAAVTVCWKKFAGFRAVILTVWATIKGFAQIIKDLVISRIQSLLQSIGKVGEALSKLFRGDFSGAWQSAKEAGALYLNVEGKRNAIRSAKELVGSTGASYSAFLEQERQKQKAKDEISDPEPAAGTADGAFPSIQTPGGDTGKIANDITTGGTRNTSINLTIGSMLQGFTINTGGMQETGEEIRDKVLEAINRALETGLSAAR